MPSTKPILPGLTPRYEYVRELGSGGMGRVILVHDTFLRKRLALKLLQGWMRIDGTATPSSAVDPADVVQLQKEFALLTTIEHPAIARAMDFGYLEGCPYFTSEHIEGSPLGAGGKLTGASLIEHARALAEAVAFIHARGILHLDIKPANVIVPDDPARGRVVLIDFGLCRKGQSGPPDARLKGTLPYMAPEYFRDEVLGPWTDVYAMGVALYRVATGRFPRKDARPEMSSAGCDSISAVAPGRMGDSVPAHLDSIILKCIALDPRARFQNGAELLAVLDRAAGSIDLRPEGRGSDSPTVGRGEELAKVDAFLAAIARRDGARPSASPPALLVTGAPGMGQSQVMREAKVRAQTKGIRFYLETGYAGRAGPPGSLLRCLSASSAPRVGRPWERFVAKLSRPRRPPLLESPDGDRRLRWAQQIARVIRSVHEPLVLAVDGLQFCDEVSIEMLILLARYIGSPDEPAQGQRPPVGLMLGFREEGTSSRLLRELSAYLVDVAKAEIVTLRPLDVREAFELYRSRSGTDACDVSRLALYQETHGVPSCIVSAARAGGADRSATPAKPRDVAPRSTPPLPRDAIRILQLLDLMGHPTSARTLAAIGGIRASRMERLVTTLRSAGLLAAAGDRAADTADDVGPRPDAAHALAPMDASRRAALHRRIGVHLCRAATGADDPRLIEGLHHLRRGGHGAMVARLGVRAAGYLKSTSQNRAALDLFRAVLESLPRRSRKARLDVSLEMAELEARTSNVDEGIRVLKELLEPSRGLAPGSRTKVILRLASLYSRRGDFRRAAALFREGLHAPGARARLTPRELLLFLNEHAAMKAFVGEYEGALQLCDEGFRLAGRRRSFEIREVVLNLHATRASVAMRTFDHASAIRDFETSLQIAEAIGSPVNQAVVLNNLGIVYSNCDRFREAVRCFRDAEKHSLRQDEGPSLVSIYANLAVLHAKMGDFPAMEAALRAAEDLRPAGLGRRQEVSLAHARGLSLVYRGRYVDARPHLEDAIRLGRETGDALLAGFDEVYRAEALLFEGAHADAERELRRLADAGAARRVKKMALSRLAFLLALLGQPKALASAAERHAAFATERPVPFLDAWDAVFLAWAFSIGRGDDPRLDETSAYFTDCGLRPAADLTRWIRAEASFLRGEHAAARAILANEPAASDLTAILRPLLLARLALDSSGAAASAERPLDLLADAGTALSGNALGEWAVRVQALQGHLSAAGESPRAGIETRRRELCAGLSESAKKLYVHGRHWKLWTDGLRPVAPRGTEDEATGPEETREAGAKTALLGGRAASTTSAIVARSPAMRRVVAVLERLKSMDLPVLIEGETGSGKELIARAIHEESGRAKGPFLVLDCASIPSELHEAELFGARAGAFTDLTEDRPGILVQARAGTLLLDEIAGASLELQAKLLRAITSRKCRRVGDEVETPIDCRFLFSTSRDLAREVREGRFRDDLFHRVKVVTLELPPLRERLEDLTGLVDLFLRRRGDRESNGTGRAAGKLDAKAMDLLRRMPWPGNVRELENVLARLSIEAPGRITAEAVGRVFGEPAPQSAFPRGLLAQESLVDLQGRLERDYIVHHLGRLQGDTNALAKLLGVNRQQLYRRFRRLGLRLRAEKRKLRPAE